MDLTVLIAKVLGPLLLVRGLSIGLNRRHFHDMVDGLEREAATVAFSMFPVAMFGACLTLALTHSDTTSLAAILIQIIAWGGMVKTGALMLFPRLIAAKARVLMGMGMLNLVFAACVGVGGYFTWFGYFR